MRNRFFVLIACLLCAFSLGLPQLSSKATLLRDGTGLYPRVVRLSHNAEANGRVLAAVNVPEENESLIYESLDNGGKWLEVGAVRDPEMASGLCCLTLFEVPQQLGDLPAGTLLWAASIGQQSSPLHMSLKIWKSLDRGRSWTYLSSCYSANGGLWEPEFSVDAQGRLVCHFSDETEQPLHSQTLRRTVSSDGGKTWSQPTSTVSSLIPNHRPGMPVVRKLSSGQYVMTYEICGTFTANCAAFIRHSEDGWNWGNPRNLGTRIFSNRGNFFAHTPTLELSPDGRLLLTGQMLFDAKENQLPGTGRTLFINPNNGNGPWLEAPTPFAIDNVFDNYCPNYSSPLLPSPDGSQVLMLASDYQNFICKPFYGVGPLPKRLRVMHDTLGKDLGQINYGGNWKHGSESQSNSAGASLEFRFTGAQVWLGAIQSPQRGKIAISIDGGAEAQVDLYSSTSTTSAKTVFTSSLKPGPHTLKLRVLGTKNPASSGSLVGIGWLEFE